MAKAFDAVGKELINRGPATWLALGRLPVPAGRDSVRPGSVDLSGYTASADWIGRVAGPAPYTAHLELQAGPDPGLDTRVLLYHVLAGRKYGWPVRSVVFLLRPPAQSGATGRVLEELGPDSGLDFRYRVVRVWQLPVEQLLAGGLATLPLAPVAAVADPGRDLPGIYRRLWRRLEREAPDRAQDFWGMTYVLSGLRHTPPVARALMSGVHMLDLRESATVQEILAEGRAEGVREMLIRLAKAKLGPPDAASRAALKAITDVTRLQAIADRLATASTWTQLLGEPPRRRRRS